MCKLNNRRWKWLIFCLKCLLLFWVIQNFYMCMTMTCVWYSSQFNKKIDEIIFCDLHVQSTKLNLIKILMEKHKISVCHKCIWTHFRWLRSKTQKHLIENKDKTTSKLNYSIKLATWIKQIKKNMYPQPWKGVQFSFENEGYTVIVSVIPSEYFCFCIFYSIG